MATTSESNNSRSLEGIRDDGIVDGSMPSLYLDHLLLYINTYSTCRQISIWSASTNKVVVSLLRESLSLPRLESRDSMRWPGTHIDHPSTQQHYIYTESLGVHSSQSTTGISSFAECQVHSAKPQKHPAKALPSVCRFVAVNLHLVQSINSM